MKKYIKKYINELNVGTYVSAANKLANMSHYKRSDNLEKFANNKIINTYNSSIEKIIKDYYKYSFISETGTTLDVYYRYPFSFSDILDHPLYAEIGDDNEFEVIFKNLRVPLQPDVYFKFSHKNIYLVTDETVQLNLTNGEIEIGDMFFGLDRDIINKNEKFYNEYAKVILEENEFENRRFYELNNRRDVVRIKNMFNREESIDSLIQSDNLSSKKIKLLIEYFQKLPINKLYIE